MPEIKEVGFLDSTSPESRGNEIGAFLRGLAATVNGSEGVRISYFWAGNNHGQLSLLANELCNRGVKVIVASGGTVTAVKAKEEAEKIAIEPNRPAIVFTAVTDPVSIGLVASLDAPGGRATGVAGITAALDPRRLEELHRLTGASIVGVLFNPSRTTLAKEKKALEDKANSLQLTLKFQPAETLVALAPAFDGFVRDEVGAVLVASDPFFYSARQNVVKLERERNLAAMHQWRGFVEAGGLVSFGPRIETAYKKAGEYAGKILGGTNPASLPVVPVDSFEMVINRERANHFSVPIPAGAVVI